MSKVKSPTPQFFLIFVNFLTRLITDSKGIILFTNYTIQSLHAVECCTMFSSAADFFLLISKTISVIPSKYQKVWTEIRPDWPGCKLLAKVISRRH